MLVPWGMVQEKEKKENFVKNIWLCCQFLKKPKNDTNQWKKLSENQNGWSNKN